MGRIIAWHPDQFFDLQGQPPPSSSVRNLTVSNVRGSFERFGQLRGHERVSISEVAFEDFDVRLVDPRLDLGPVTGLVVKDVTVNGAALEPAGTEVTLP